MFDIVLILILLGFIAWGVFRGFVRILGSFIGLIVAIVISGRYYLLLSDFLDFIPIGDNLLKILSFFIILAVVTRLVVFGISLLFKFISIVPLVKTANRLLGALVGSFIGIFIVGSLIYLISRYPINSFFENLIVNSEIAPVLLTLYKPITILLPEILRQLKSLI